MVLLKTFAPKSVWPYSDTNVPNVKFRSISVSNFLCENECAWNFFFIFSIFFLCVVVVSNFFVLHDLDFCVVISCRYV